MDRKRVQAKLVRFWHSWGKMMLIAILAVTSFRSAIADWNDVPTGSMRPTVLEGDRIFVNKLAYDLRVPFTTWQLARWDQPERGDVVVFFSPLDDTRLVKRVVAVPGDVLSLRGNRLTINGEQASYRPVAGDDDACPNEHRFIESVAGAQRAVQFTSRSPLLSTVPEITIPPGQYFMMGDNRCNSADSRVFGPVDMGCIVGRAGCVVLSVDHEHLFRPRWDRFFSALQ